MVQCAIGQTIQTFDWRIMNFNNGKATMTIAHLFKYRYMCTTNTFVGKKNAIAFLLNPVTQKSLVGNTNTFEMKTQIFTIILKPELFTLNTNARIQIMRLEYMKIVRILIQELRHSYML